MHELTAASHQATRAAPSAHRQEAEPRIFRDADKLRQTNSPDSRLRGQEDGSFSSLNPPYGKQAKENALSSSMGCFMKGTLVETEEGWTPIDELKVGDLVMSRPENGIGEAVPKRVVNTFRYEDKEVVMLKFSQFPERNGGGGSLVVTPNHPFCVYGVVTNLILEHPKFGKL